MLWRWFTVLIAASIALGVIRSLHGQTTGAKPAVAHRVHLRPRLRPPAPFPGYLLIADRGNNRMLLVDGAHHVYWRYPGGGAPAMPFVFDDDTFFSPNHDRVISNQEDQDTIQIISFPGKRVLWRYGHVGMKSGAPGYLNTPDDAYLLPNHLVSVADAYNCRVLFISPAHRIVRQYGTTNVCRHDPPRYLGAVNGATPLADGGTLISEINGSWIDDIGSNGRLRWAVRAPVAYPSDPQLLAPNRILLADYSKPGGAIIMTRAGRVLWRYGPTSGPGELDHPSLATRIAPGLIAINDDFRHRVVIVSIRSRRIVWQYGHTDRPGRADGYLNTPDGLDLLPSRSAQASRTLYRLLSRSIPSRHVSITNPAATGGVRISVRFHLPAPVEREVAVAADSKVVIAGGLDASGNSTSGVFRLNPTTGKLTSLGSVPQAFHDAAGGIVGRSLEVFGGGAAQSSSTVQRFDLSTNRSRVVARLPRLLSDVAAASTARALYLVGGYDGHVPRPEIYRTADGLRFVEVARLPTGLRYPAVTAVGRDIVIAGGTSSHGLSDRIFDLDTATGKLRTLGRLPQPVAHAEAFSLAGSGFVAGGVDRAGSVTGAVFRVDPTTSQITRVPGSLPVADAATVVIGRTAFVLGGSTAQGTTGTVREVVVR